MNAKTFKEAIHESLRATSATIYCPPEAIKELNIVRPRKSVEVKAHPRLKEKKPGK